MDEILKTGKLPDHISYHSSFKDDYLDTFSHLKNLHLPIMAKDTYEYMRYLFRCKHGFSQLHSSLIMGGYHGLFLYGMVKIIKPNIVLDIGTCLGFSALCAALALEEENVGGTVISIDRSHHTDYGRDSYFDRLRTERVIELIGDSKELLPLKLDCPLELVMIDGGHDYPYVSFDLAFTASRLTDNGIIIVDDHDEAYPGIIQAVSETQAKFHLHQYIYGRLCLLSPQALTH